MAGSTAAVSMPAGSLLTGSDIGTPPPVKGQVRLGVALKPGQYPPDLAAGQDVDVLATPASATVGLAPPARAARRRRCRSARRWCCRSARRRRRAAAGTRWWSFRCRQDAMPQVAAASAAGQIALATIPAGG